MKPQIAKKLVLGDDLQSQAAQFAKRPNYAEAIRTAYPEANAILTKVEHDGICRFIATLFVLE